MPLLGRPAWAAGNGHCLQHPALLVRHTVLKAGHPPPASFPKSLKCGFLDPEPPHHPIALPFLSMQVALFRMLLYFFLTR